MATYEVIGVGEYAKYFDEQAYQNTVQYVLNREHTAYCGGANIEDLNSAAEEMEAVAVQYGKNSGKRVRHSVLSFSRAEEERISPQVANFYAKRIVEYYAPEYQIIYGVHNNTDNLHIHFLMNQISYVDGHRYAGKKKDYYGFQKHIRNVTHLPIIAVKKGS